MTGCGSLILLVLLQSSSARAADQDHDIKDAKDHPAISRFAGSVITAYAHADFDEIGLPGEVPKGKPSGDTNYSIFKKTEGKTTWIGYVLPAGKSVVEAKRVYQINLEKAGFKVVAHYDGDRSSGSGWYPTFFTKHMDGRMITTSTLGDSSYFLARLEKNGASVWVACYFFHPSGYGEEGRQRAAVSLLVLEEKNLDSGQISVSAESLQAEIEKSGHVSVYGINFATDSANILSGSEPPLDAIAGLLQKNPKMRLLVVGHTDMQGDFQHNWKLSQSRAASVKAHLVTKKQIAENRLFPYGIGFLSPVASNRTPEGQALNRRVELIEYR